MDKSQNNQITSFEEFLTSIYLCGDNDNSVEQFSLNQSFFTVLPKAPSSFNVRSIVTHHMLPDKVEAEDIDDKIEREWLKTFKNIRKELLNVENTLEPSSLKSNSFGDFIHSLNPLSIFSVAATLSLLLAILITVYAPNRADDITKVIDSMIGINSKDIEVQDNTYQASVKYLDKETKANYIIQNRNKLQNKDGVIEVPSEEIFGKVAGVEEEISVEEAEKMLGEQNLQDNMAVNDALEQSKFTRMIINLITKFLD